MDLYRDGSTAVGYINDDANVIDWLAQLKPQAGVPQFAYIHLMSVHTLGYRHPEFRKWQPASMKGFHYPLRPVNSTVDVAPTLLRRIGAAIPGSWVGEPLGTPLRRQSVVMQSSLGRALVGQFDGTLWKYVIAGEGVQCLFNLTRGPHEREDRLRHIDGGLIIRGREAFNAAFGDASGWR